MFQTAVKKFSRFVVRKSTFFLPGKKQIAIDRICTDGGNAQIPIFRDKLDSFRRALELSKDLIDKDFFLEHVSHLNLCSELDFVLNDAKVDLGYIQFNALTPAGSFGTGEGGLHL